MSQEQANLAQFIVLTATLAVVIAYTIVTYYMQKATRDAAEASRQTVSAMRESQEWMTRPYVVPYADVLPNSRVDFVLENASATAAVDVKLSVAPLAPEEFAPDPRREHLRHLLATGVKYMPPHAQMRWVWTTGPEAAQWARQVLPVQVSYRAANQDAEFAETYDLGMADLLRMALRGRAPLQEIALSLAEIEKDVRRMAAGSRAAEGPGWEAPVDWVRPSRPAPFAARGGGAFDGVELLPPDKTSPRDLPPGEQRDQADAEPPDAST